eukprot:CAMPEP_0204641766 /NCGR_PEP_ID=MMETSP0717-20131115/51318_1 /ASSEMBLY_ACC=CAM_ASM_000666 /TAXON_ID=230516 /ORGANISM="Chaetoceros curvisetus" /LENGTH=549 /DNA_ID=CAMNT_0051662475 /DNA_START=877 /DNA_END=2526 /DNA_ORIENTATION=+
MNSKWTDLGMELAAFHLQSKRFESIRPPSFGEHPHLDSVVRKRERRDRMTPQRLKNILDDDVHEDGVDHASVAIESTLRKRHSGRKSQSPSRNSINSLRPRKAIHNHGFKEEFSSSLDTSGNSNRLRSPKTPLSRRDQLRVSKLVSVANLDGGMEEMSPSLFLQEASHLISLLSAVAFTTLRNDLQKAPSPLAEYTVGSPWPSVDPDAETSDEDGRNYHEMSNARKALNYLLGNMRSAEQRTIYNACRPFRVLGGVSDAEIDLLQRARGPLAKTALVTMWLQEFISREFEKGALGKTPPPVVSRLYQFVNEMSNARKALNYLLGNMRSAEQRTIYNACRPFRVLGGVSDAEIDLLQRARGPLAKTALVTMWLQEFISREFEKGALGKTPPPVVSRLYQFVSDGMIGYNQARKVAYVPFPFAHTQLTTFYVVVIIFLLPILMLTFVHEVIVAALLNGLTVGVFVGLWQVSNELEDPFRNVPNDLPLNYFQAEFNEALVVMFAGYHPESWWDVGDNLEGISGKDLESVQEKLYENEPIIIKNDLDTVMENV